MTMKLIATSTLASSNASIDFDNIPQSYSDLLLVTSTRSTVAAVYGSVKYLFNGSTSSRSYRYLEGNGTNPGSSNGSTFLFGGSGTGNSATSNTFANGQLYIPNYASTTINKSSSAEVAGENNATTTYLTISANLWASTAAITSISVTTDSGDSFVAGSTASLYGILKGSGGATVS